MTEHSIEELGVMRWRTIESAPTDGTHYLALFPDDGVAERWIEQRKCHDGIHKYPHVLVLPSHGCGCCSDNNPEPTHWMPLPAAPSAPDSGDA